MQLHLNKHKVGKFKSHTSSSEIEVERENVSLKIPGIEPFIPYIPIHLHSMSYAVDVVIGRVGPTWRVLAKVPGYYLNPQGAVHSKT